VSACRGTPISWLRLERYHAGELLGPERETVATHLATCDACAACLERIAGDDRALPPLATVSPRTALRATRPWHTRGRTAAVVSGLAFAAVLLVLVGRQPRTASDGGNTARMKGNAIAFALVHETEGVLPEAGGVYHDGDRLKALVTCPPGMRASFDVVVFEGAEASFPLGAGLDVACGNQVSLPGAFRVTGRERMTVCLVWSDDGSVDRAAVRRSRPELLPHAQCKALDPAP
jgi:hypothetical protein